MVTHVPGRYEQTARYYGYYSNKFRGLRKKAETDDDIPVIVKNEMSSQEWRQNWARLIQKIYEVDPLLCAKCQGEMRIIVFIEDETVIKKILNHLGLWKLATMARRIRGTHISLNQPTTTTILRYPLSITGFNSF